MESRLLYGILSTSTEKHSATQQSKNLEIVPSVSVQKGRMQTMRSLGSTISTCKVWPQSKPWAKNQTNILQTKRFQQESHMMKLHMVHSGIRRYPHTTTLIPWIKKSWHRQKTTRLSITWSFKAGGVIKSMEMWLKDRRNLWVSTNGLVDHGDRFSSIWIGRMCVYQIGPCVLLKITYRTFEIPGLKIVPSKT